MLCAEAKTTKSYISFMLLKLKKKALCPQFINIELQSFLKKLWKRDSEPP